MSAYSFFRKIRPVAIVACSVSTLALTGCVSMMPNDGPLRAEIAARKAAANAQQIPYAVVDVSTKNIAALRETNAEGFRNTFGRGGAAGTHIVGIGDTLNLTIFESAQDGLFTSAAQKNLSLDLQVDNKGHIPVPYAGTVKVAGKTFEQIRTDIVSRLRDKTSEPDVIVSLKTNNTQFVSVNGAVGRPNMVPLTGREKILDALAAAGGPSNPPYETDITLSRGSKTKTLPLQALVENPSDNIFLRPSDQLFLVHAPRTFSAFGAVNKKDNIKFGTIKLSLAEAASLAGGIDAGRGDPGGYFLFRYEKESVLKKALDTATFKKLVDNKSLRNADGNWPVVYRIDLAQADGYFLAQQFEMQDKDVIYVSRKPSVDLLKFIGALKAVSSEVRAY